MRCLTCAAPADENDDAQLTTVDHLRRMLHMRVTECKGLKSPVSNAFFDLYCQIQRHSGACEHVARPRARVLTIAALCWL
jgi:hypothetical protein